MLKLLIYRAIFGFWLRQQASAKARVLGAFTDAPSVFVSKNWSILDATQTCHIRFAVLQLLMDDFEVSVQGNPSACTHLHLHGFVKQMFSKSVKFTWTMPLPSASLSEVR